MCNLAFNTTTDNVQFLQLGNSCFIFMDYKGGVFDFDVTAVTYR